MSTIMIEIPTDLVEALRLPPAEQPERLRRELAVRLYQKRMLSFGKARELAQLNKWEFHNLLGEEGVLRSYDLQDLENDLHVLESLP
jgi:predicted HTH domain antitoxin